MDDNQTKSIFARAAVLNVTQPSLCRIVLSYALVALLWVLLSAVAAEQLWHSPVSQLWANRVADVVLIVATAGFFYRQGLQCFDHLLLQQAELQNSAESQARALAGSQLGFWDWNLVTSEVQRNAIWAEMLGYSFDEIRFTTQQWTDFVHPEDRERAWASIYAVLEGRAAEHEMTYRMKTKQGHYKWIRDRARVVQRDATGKPLRMSGTHSDVDHLKKTEEALQDSERRFRGIFENAGVGIAEVALDGSFLLINDKFCRITGYSREELLTLKKNFQAITFPEDLPTDLHNVNCLLKGLNRGYEFEKRYLRKDGSIAWVHISVALLTDADRQPLRFISAVQDITALAMAQKELERQARMDYLTGLANRRYFMELARHELVRVQRYASPLAVIMVDIDFFKQVNDLYGHSAGDQVLQKTAQIMREVLREADIIGRIGGEEFAILLPETDKRRATEVAHRLQSTIANNRILLDSGVNLSVTVSIGFAMLSEQDRDIEPVLNKADTGLYHAKSKGRNTVVYADDALS